MAARVKVIDRAPNGKPKRFLTADTYSFDASKRRMTAEGFMEVPGCNIARTGVQEYTAKELGVEGSNRMIRLLRPPDAVFDAAALASFENQTLTSGHPPGGVMVNAGNWRSYCAGDVRDVAQGEDGKHVTATLCFKDTNAIEDVVTYGRDQLSCGYSFELDMTPGEFEGQAYDGVQKAIQGNHVAHVYAARGGPGLRVADQKRKGTNMRTVTIDGTNVNFEDDNQGAMVELALNRAKAEVKAATDGRDAAVTEATAAKTALKAATDAAAAAKTAHDAKVAELQAQIVTGDAIDALVEAKTKVVAGAKAIIGDSFDGAGKTPEAIRLEALEAVAKDAKAYPGVIAVLGGKAPKDAKAEIVALAFDAAVAVKAAAGDEDEGGTRRGASDEDAKAFAPGSTGGARGGSTSGARVIDYKARHSRKTNGGTTASQQ